MRKGFLMSSVSTYEQSALDFLQRFGLEFKAEFVDKSCPPFCDDSRHIHGWKYQVTLTRGERGGTLSFLFWNSWNDTHEPVRAFPRTSVDRRIGSEPKSVRVYCGHESKVVSRSDASPPSAYDVLSCISSDAHCAADFAEWCSGFGYDTDSRKAFETHQACVVFALKLRQFFSAEELDALAEIQ